MSLTTMLVGGKSYLINTKSSAADKVVVDILAQYPDDEVVDFRKPTKEDLQLNSYFKK